jgi:hypothetical protein
MGEVIGEVLPFGVGVALSPFSIVAVVLILATARARSNGPVFLIGWLVGSSSAASCWPCRMPRMRARTVSQPFG